MAAREALDAEPNAAEHAKAFNRFVGILRAGGFEAAGAGEEDREVGLVAPNCEETYANRKGRWSSRFGHGVFSSFNSSAVSALNGAVATLGLG